MLLVLLLSAGAAACNTSGRANVPKTALSKDEFIETFVELAKATSEEERRQILERRGTSQQELEAFVRAYSRDLDALSEIFDTIVARTGADPERRAWDRSRIRP
ncbi:MAG TPA: hypothetical protein VIL32_05930 [Steroidobacteraceae bacterium]